MSRLAVVGQNRQIQLLDPDAQTAWTLTAPLPRVPGPWSALHRAQEAWTWPTWSADGSWIAAFAVEGSDTDTGPARLSLLSTDGVRQVELAELPGAPIYMQWHPRGDHLCVLTQQGQELALGLVRTDQLGRVRPLAQGVPLFFNWTSGGERLMLHTGGGRGDARGRLIFRDPLGTDEDVQLDDLPGSFCAPVAVGERAVFAIRADGASDVVTTDLRGRDRRTLWRSPGLLAIVAGPPGSGLVALSHAPHGEGTPYRGIDLLHLESGAMRRISDRDNMAFFWSPDGRWLLQAVVESDQNCLTWYRVPAEGGEAAQLGTFWPTRDLLFYLHFFDQYTTSHPLISPDARWLAYAGYPAGGGQADLSKSPRVFLKDLAGDAPAEETIEGVFVGFPGR